jgi:hypothetical protein
VDINEMQILGPAGRVKSHQETLQEVFAAIEQRGILRIYGDRWVANQVHIKMKDRVWVPLEDSIYWSWHDDEVTPIVWSEKTALLVENDLAARSRRCLEECGIRMRETEVGPWILFDFAPGEWKPEYASREDLVWTGLSCLRGNTKRYAAAITEQGRDYAKRGETQKAFQLFEEAERICPGIQFPLWEACELAKQRKDEKESERFGREYAALTMPAKEAEVRFSGGVELLGVTLEKDRARAGERVGLKYFWRCPTSVDPFRMVVFVHFLNQDARFQDDHEFLKKFRRDDFALQPIPEVFVEDRVVTVPTDARPGEYRMNIGLYSSQDDRRLAPQTKWPVDHRRVELPVSLIVEQD